MSVPKSVVLEAVYQAGFEGDAWTEEYSGRYMYGKTCFGIIGHVQDLARFLIELTTLSVEGHDYALEFAARISMDNMARDHIFYFPGLELTEDEPEDA